MLLSLAVSAHVGAILPTNPVQRPLQEVLPVCAAAVMRRSTSISSAPFSLFAELSFVHLHCYGLAMSRWRLEKLLGVGGTPAMLMVSNHCLISLSVPSHSWISNFGVPVVALVAERAVESSSGCRSP